MRKVMYSLIPYAKMDRDKDKNKNKDKDKDKDKDTDENMAATL